jgi:nucleoside-diphosphate-sugar epimerase
MLILVDMSKTPIFEKKNVIVTGGAGFIGSHLCERLLQEAKVICIDDFSNSSIQNIDHLLQYPDFEFVKADANQPIDLESFPELDKFKFIKIDNEGNIFLEKIKTGRHFCHGARRHCSQDSLGKPIEF